MKNGVRGEMSSGIIETYKGKLHFMESVGEKI